MTQQIDADRTLIFAADVPFEKYERILRATGDLDPLGGYKIGMSLMVEEGLPEIDLDGPALYNHCGGATDIPDTGKNLVEALKTNPQIEGIILTPLAGPKTQEVWTNAAKEKGLKVYLEPVLDVPNFLEKDGGYLADAAVGEMIRRGLYDGVDGIILPETELGDGIIAEHNLRGKSLDLVRRNGDLLGSDYLELTSYQVLSEGLKPVVELTREYAPDKAVIYDHQKAATHDSKGAECFMDICRNADVDYVILFPQAGPFVQKKWTDAAKAAGLGRIVGGMMTHPKYIRAEGGFLLDSAPERIYGAAIDEDITEFVLPGNKLEKAEFYKEFMAENGLENPAIWSPGLVTQGGEISKAAKLYGRIRAIVGRGIGGAENPREAVKEHASQF